jgi:hypothetical protein
LRSHQASSNEVAICKLEHGKETGSAAYLKRENMRKHVFTWRHHFSDQKLGEIAKVE